ncbi:MAG: tetratricopeptide repeat protein [Cyclobacteriaceae bacterium]|nr:tetratricopeptide repeat protein [Cyclobacteriaceae bacterium]
MVKIRIVLFVTAVLLVVLLFSLPRTVVDNAPESLGASAGAQMNAAPIDGATSADQHTNDPLAIQEINRLRDLFLNNLNTEKSIIFADSLAMVFRKANYYDSAAHYYALLAERKASNEVWLRTADAYYDAFGFAMDARKRMELAGSSRDFYNKILEQDPGNLNVKAKMAMTYVSSENPMQGITVLREVLAEDPENQQAILNLGLLAITSGQYDRAIERFQRLIEINPDDVQAVFYLGYCMIETGDRKKAVEYFKKAAQLNPDQQLRAAINNYLEILN